MEGSRLHIEVVGWTAGEFVIIAYLDTFKADGYYGSNFEVVGWTAGEFVIISYLDTQTQILRTSSLPQNHLKLHLNHTFFPLPPFHKITSNYISITHSFPSLPSTKSPQITSQSHILSPPSLPQNHLKLHLNHTFFPLLPFHKITSN
jgi:hypothetical protein